MNKHFKKLFTESLLSKSGKTTKLPPSTGRQAEQLACKHLQKHKLDFVASNYHCRGGEIDLIMREQNCLVFVEVRYRQNINFGTPFETVNSHKIKRIKTAINHYLMTNNLGYIPCRFDVIGLHGNIGNPNIEWLKNVIIE